ncbi:carbohydrate kinase [Obba rivulosa]|uniref:gluconokinase n=1 Tax=Obba rivulosa TaxID=1052685 RepID=A0A8E2DQC3_9APHY|nr:carbohydrate kinase [Obba rivulosa]
MAEVGIVKTRLQQPEQASQHQEGDARSEAQDAGKVQGGSESSRKPYQRSPVLIIVMGVSGTGKSTLARAIASTLRVPYIEGDALHPAENIAKMAANIPLSDADRAPWLARCRATAERVVRGDRNVEGLVAQEWDGVSWEEAHSRGVVLTCSSLKRVYREVLRGNVPESAVLSPSAQTPASARPPATTLRTVFVYIEGPRELLLGRMEAREGHYMKADMLQSQLDTLESPVGEEDVIRVSAEQNTEEQVGTAMEELKRFGVL